MKMIFSCQLLIQKFNEEVLLSKELKFGKGYLVISNQFHCLVNLRNNCIIH